MAGTADDWIQDRDFCAVLPILAVLGREGCYVGEPVFVTSKVIGRKLQISQQSANRLLLLAESMRLITRKQRHNGQEVELTAEALQRIARCNADFEQILATKAAIEVSIEGRITSGLGEGRYYVSVYAHLFESFPGWLPYPGTLNIQLENHEEVRKLEQVLQTRPSYVFEEFAKQERVFGEVRLWEAKVSAKDSSREAILVRPVRTHHNNVLELVARVNLRQECGLEDNDRVVVVIPLNRGPVP